MLQVSRTHPNDKDARAKYTECNKIVKRIAFEKAISVDDAKKSVVDQINLDAMSKSVFTDFEALCA
jgi:serine/threonine-protein phosphatase 5